MKPTDKVTVCVCDTVSVNVKVSDCDETGPHLPMLQRSAENYAQFRKHYEQNMTKVEALKADQEV